jgi:hypothetical protein
MSSGRNIDWLEKLLWPIVVTLVAGILILMIEYHTGFFQKIAENPTPIPTQPAPAACFDWETCWSYDDNTKTMTWVGPNDGDIGQRGISLTKLQSGYTAIFANSVTMKMEICKGAVDGQEIAKDCTPQVLTIDPGTHQVVSLGNQGGFRAYP